MSPSNPKGRVLAFPLQIGRRRGSNVAEISRRRAGELVRGVFRVLIDHPDGLQAKTVLESVQQVVPPTEFEKATYPKNPAVRRYEKIIRFATIAPVKAGWLAKNRGLWLLTDEGKKAYEKFSDAEQFAREAGRLYQIWAKEQPEPDEVEVDEESAETTATVEEAEESAWSEIEEHLSQMNPFDFQNLVAGLLRGMGYYVAWISPPGPDRGVDIIAHSDPLGINGPRIKVQVKRKAEKTAVDGVRSFMAVVGDSDVGLFVSMAGFTKDAEGEARHQEKRRLMLVDARKLFDLWIEHYDRIPEVHRRLLPLKPVYFLAPTD